MSEDSTSIAVFNKEDLPAFMQDSPQVGIDELSTHQTTPRFAIVQSQSSPDRKDQFGEGSVVVFPDGIKVCEAGEEFTVIPLLFWASWEKRSDIMDTMSPMVVESSHDENSTLAMKCRNPETRTEPYADNPQFSYKYMENLNFIMRIDSGPAAGTHGLVSFNGGEHYTGQKLCSFLKRRPCSIYGNRISLKAARRQRQNKSWFGFDFNNPSDAAFVENQELFQELKQQHTDLRSLVKSAQYTPADVETTTEQPVLGVDI